MTSLLLYNSSMELMKLDALLRDMGWDAKHKKITTQSPSPFIFHLQYVHTLLCLAESSGMVTTVRKCTDTARIRAQNELYHGR